MHIKSKPLAFVLLLILFIIVVLVIRALYVYVSVGIFRKSWERGNQQRVSEDSIVIVALGDSTVQGIGALRPQDGFVGNVARRVERQTGKKVQVYNFSKSGAESGEVLSEQLQKVKQLPRYDVALLAVGPNDITHKKSLKDFKSNLATILRTLDASKTVVSNFPPMDPKDSEGNSSYEWGEAAQRIAQSNGARVAKVYQNVKPRNNDPRIFAGDFYHPSGTGYQLWANAFTPEVLKVLNK